MSKGVALITGVSGQDGSYLSEHLLDLGYEVHGLLRPSSQGGNLRLLHILNNDDYKDKFFIHHGDLLDPISIFRVLKTVEPQFIYNLAAQSHVNFSYSLPEYTTAVNSLGPQRILEAIKILGMSTSTRFYQASSSEIFGESNSGLFDENSKLGPNTPYGLSKLYGYWATRHYKETYGIFTSNGFSFSHESPRRGENFVSRKVASAVARIASGSPEPLRLGDLTVKRDWGHAKDYVKAMHLMLAYERAEDFVLATGEIRSLREFVELAFNVVGERLDWSGEGLELKARSQKSGKILVAVDKRFFRPNRELVRVGNTNKAKKLLNWESQISFEGLVTEMVEYEVNLLKREGHQN